jgi:hypothetical protein
MFQATTTFATAGKNQAETGLPGADEQAGALEKKKDSETSWKAIVVVFSIAATSAGLFVTYRRWNLVQEQSEEASLDNFVFMKKVIGGTNAVKELMEKQVGSFLIRRVKQDGNNAQPAKNTFKLSVVTKYDSSLGRSTHWKHILLTRTARGQPWLLDGKYVGTPPACTIAEMVTALSTEPHSGVGVALIDSGLGLAKAEQPIFDEGGEVRPFFLNQPA